jgi:pimeloyl-ACP methyl ester carboxylesterase
MMTGKTRTSNHPTAIGDVYGLMLHAARARGRFIQTPSGRRVHVIDAGDGPPVVHLHGTNTSALSHLMVVERMPSVRSYAVDRPGCGLSDRADVPRRHFRDHAVRFVDEVLDGLQLDSAVLVGASGGGIWATWYAQRHPERVRGLVMLGSVPLLPGSRWSLPLRMMAMPVLGGLLTRGVKPNRRMVVRLLASVGEGNTIVRYPDLIDSVVAGARDPITVAANLAELRACMSPFGLRSAMRIRPEHLRQLAVPTLMIWGEHDPIVPIADARAAAELIPDARLEVLPAGHAPQLGHPERVAELLNGFIARTPQCGVADREGPT